MPPPSCAGDKRLCGKRYDQVTWLTTHNAYATEGIFADPNQTLTIAEQLAKGVRGFMLDTWVDPETKELSLCHSRCTAGRTPITSPFATLRTFLEQHPSEIVTLLIEDNAPNALLFAALQAAGLQPYLHQQIRGTPWPTLGEMIAANHRLVVFTGICQAQQDACVDKTIAQTDAKAEHWYSCGPNGTEKFPGLHVTHDFMWETPYGDVPGTNDPPCPWLRGNRQSGLLLVNYFVTRKWIARPARKQIPASLPARVRRCVKAGHHPNFLTIDWTGGKAHAKLLRLVRAMNVGR